MQTIEQLYYEDTNYKLYTTPSPDENHRGKMIFELYINNETFIYELSGHPYIPILIAKCINHSENSFSIAEGLFFPSNEVSQTEWGRFCKDLSKEVYKYINL